MQRVWEDVGRALNTHIANSKATAGGDDAEAYILTTEDGGKYFAKFAPIGELTKLESEYKGARAIYDTHTIFCPEPLMVQKAGDGVVFVSEFVNMSGRLSQGDLYQKFASQLADLHMAPQNDPDVPKGKFGFPVNNWCGEGPQTNTWCDTWQDFYANYRLRTMTKLIDGRHGASSSFKRNIEDICNNIGSFFEAIDEVKPSLVHGDLWSGNYAAARVSQERLKRFIQERHEREGVSDDTIHREMEQQGVQLKDSSDWLVPVIYDAAPCYAHYEFDFGIMWYVAASLHHTTLSTLQVTRFHGNAACLGACRLNFGRLTTKKCHKLGSIGMKGTTYISCIII
eukprot:gb/GECG01013511.1/.p1 GENE.gb/GECG01013511.1/~~gb/GECG01013511.1/.p1  ORF type:complete len:340 (+),score=31.57 gb/GECG01013511.1/:1-1020(+)